MRMALRSLALILIMTASAMAGPLGLSLPDDPPQVIEDSTKPRQCTMAWLLTDLATSDIFLARMQIAPNLNTIPVKDRFPCPEQIAPRLADRALAVCTARAEDSRTCVFADMARGFERDPALRGTAENAARCGSDLYSHIGVACWRAGDLQVCNTACGKTEDDAKRQARGRCETKHGQPCEITGVAPILAP